jgi:hypothetical protein
MQKHKQTARRPIPGIARLPLAVPGRLTLAWRWSRHGRDEYRPKFIKDYG